MENVMASPTSQYKPLTNDQKYAVREAQFQWSNTKESAQAAIQNAYQNMLNVIEKIGFENGLTKDDKVEFQLVTLEFTDKQ
jgi:hypothetical protein